MTHEAYKGQIIWIIGASSGIGSALACELAASGAILVISSRREKELNDLRQRLSGERHVSWVVDITDLAEVERAAKSIHASFDRIDRVILMAAGYEPMNLDAMDMERVRQIVAVNLTGALNVVHAVLPFLTKQQFAQIALCGSVAGYIGLPGGQPYSATKAALINLAESLRAEQGQKIDVKLISPGFVRTALTDKNDFSMPMIISPEEAAAAISQGLLSSRFEVHFPRRFSFLMKILRGLPYAIALKITQKMKRSGQ